MTAAAHDPDDGTLRRLEAQLEQALAAADAGCWEYQPGSDRYRISDGAQRLLGCSATSAPRCLADWLDRLHPDDRPTLQATVDDTARRESGRFATEYRFRRDDESWVWIEDRGCVVERAADGRPLLVAGILSDIGERRQATLALGRQNRALRLMSGVAQALIRHEDESTMLAEICSLAVEIGGYQGAWIAQAMFDSEKRVIPLAECGMSMAALRDLNLSWADVQNGRGPTGRAIRTGIPVIINDTLHDPQYAQWRNFARDSGYHSSAALPIRIDDRIIGALNLYARAANAFTDDEIPLLCDLAGELGVGLIMHRSRRALAEREGNLHQAERLARLGHFEFDPQFDTWTASPMLDEIFGIDASCVRTRKSWLELVHPDDRAMLKAYHLAQVRAHDSHFDIEYRIIRHRDGALRYVHGVGEVALDERGRIARMFGTIQDISERRMAAEELRKHSLAIEQNPNSILITDTAARIEYVNEAFLRTTGYSREEVAGANPSLLRSGQTPPETFVSLWQTLAKGEVWRGEFINRRKNGEVYQEFAIITPVRQPDGRITHYLAIKEDITEKKRTAAELDRYRNHLESLVSERTAELIKAKEEAESASHTKSAFLANISHEIRTPMNAIMGLTHLAQRDAATPEQQARLAKVADAAQHLLSIIDDVLDFSKIEAGKLTLDYQPFVLAQVCNAASGSIADKLEAKQLALHTEIDPALPTTLFGDPARIQQILANFLSNAAKFTDRGQILLGARLLEADGDGLLVRCEVRDSGIGIAPDVQARLFKPFEQADTSTTRRAGGTGLGLAICQRLAEAMAGTVGVDSTPGVGSTFWFTVRLRRSAPLVDPARLPPRNRERELAARHAGARLLLVEDNEVNEEVASGLLRGAGLQVDLARNGAEAVSLFGRQPYQLVLMDMQMPVMDGLQATRLIRALPGGTAVPILAMTANAFESDREACLAAGMNDHIAKPIDPDVLFDALLLWLPYNRLPPPPATVPTAASPAADDAARRAALGLIPGLNAEFGLQAVRGRLASYCRLLGKFVGNHMQDFTDIRRQLADGQIDEARRLAHSLKGAAGTLGATAVQQAAAALETAIRDAAPAPQIEALIVDCAIHYGDLGSALRPLLDDAPTPPLAPAATGGDAASRAALLAELKAQLRAGDIVSQHLLAEHAPVLRDMLGANFRRFEMAVHAFDFEGALTLLEKNNDGPPPRA